MKTMMNALVKAHSAPGLELQQVPVPEMGPNDVLIRVKKTAICGTDLHIEQWDAWAQKTIPVPMTIGHEFMGEIAAIGKEVSGFNIGDRVSGEGHITCGMCRNCRAGRRHLCKYTIGLGVNRPGCFAEYVVLPAVNTFRVPDSIPDRVAAIFDPLGNAVHSALSFDLVGEDVLITGAGPIGLMCIAICRMVGARNVVITDINPYRLELARDMGATRAIDTRHTALKTVMSELSMTEGFDVGLEMSGHSAAIESLLSHMNQGGRVSLLGIPSGPVTLDLNTVIFKGLQLKGIYGREMFETWYKMAMLLRMGLNIEPVITHTFPYHEFNAAFSALKQGSCGKVLLEWC